MALRALCGNKELKELEELENNPRLKNKKPVALRALCGNKELKELEKLEELKNNLRKSAIKIKNLWHSVPSVVNNNKQTV